jgi:hypothetical protein
MSDAVTWNDATSVMMRGTSASRSEATAQTASNVSPNISGRGWSRVNPATSSPQDQSRTANSDRRRDISDAAGSAMPGLVTGRTTAAPGPPMCADPDSDQQERAAIRIFHSGGLTRRTSSCTGTTRATPGASS